MTETTTGTRPFAVVTGASSGIGLELAKQFAEHDYDLLIAAEDAGISASATGLRALGSQVEALQVDLRSYEGVEVLYAAIKATGRPLDAVAINAGVGVGGDFTKGTELQAELDMIDLNVKSTVHLAKRVLADMVEANSGHVLFTSSVASTMPGPYEAVYAASKSFIQSFTEALQGELSDTDVSLTSLMPGPTETNFFHRAGMDDTKVGQSRKDDPAMVAKQGFEALMDGKKKVQAGGLKSKAQGLAAKVSPDSAKAAMHKAIAEPGSGTS